VTPAELLDLLHGFYRETFELFLARQANAQSVAAYDANNAYQQVIGRQEVHLSWLADAIAGLGGIAASTTDRAPLTKSSRGQAKGVMEADAGSQRAFIDRWAPRVATVTNARNRKMLELILGEMMEHLRMLQQAHQGRSDLLGRHADGKVTHGEVMAVRPKN
jgi:phosphoglycerate dehydrogenase-like enzyme